ncbi:MAG: response regulator [Planctomycetes bacterium]|nr:response regulator [Planctomycetota bacterium]
MPKALIVDDSGASRALLKGILVQQGFTVCEAQDGESGLRTLLAEWPIDLVLLDWHMEPMNGPAFLRELRDDPRTVGVPVIVITAEASRSAVVDAATIGVQGYIIKPFDRQLVARRIAALGLTASDPS